MYGLLCCKARSSSLILHAGVAERDQFNTGEQTNGSQAH